MIAVRLDPAAIERARAVDLLQVAARTVKVIRKGKLNFAVCPFHADTNPSCKIDQQWFYCFGCGAKGSAIDWLMRLENCTFREAVKRLGNDDQVPLKKTVAPAPDMAASEIRQEQQSEAARSSFALKWFNEAVNLRDSPAWAYLIHRGIDVDSLPAWINDSLRWHPSCVWGERGGRHGCMVGLYTDAITAEPRAIHRTAILPNGQKIGRGYLGPKAGCVIRLWPDDEVTTGLTTGEGIETMLGASTRLTHRGTALRPAWACGDAGNLAKLPVMAGIEALTILVDHDLNEVGQRAALECSARWTAAGREVHRLVPRDVGADFNDIVVAATI